MAGELSASHRTDPDRSDTCERHRLTPPEEVFASHGAALAAEDLDALAANFAEDAVIVTPAGVAHGKEGARQNFTRLFSDLPQAEWDMKTTLFGGEILFLEWSASSSENSATHGVDTFVIRDGLIRAQTVRYALAPNSR
ncbi:nuclear transport factor 2 family protein [Streptomyces sp. NPDC102364]|uniref:nuclear transport factor 2 family protein n=1 Tax=Streptomyces sp. NPDC102364 TaxID=3366161 RepID=UPI0038249638